MKRRRPDERAARERKARLEAKKSAMRVTLESRKTEARARLEARTAQTKAKAKARRKEDERDTHWRWWLLLLIVFLLLALLCNCNCNAEQPGPPPPPPEPVPAEPVEPPPAPPAPMKGELDKRDRPAFRNPTPKQLTWLGAFRMQVAARSQRLSACFVGKTGPGTLKWTTHVDPIEGSVSDHTLEPMMLGTELSKADRKCVLDVLSSPPYKLPFDDERSTPARVSLVIEF